MDTQGGSGRVAVGQRLTEAEAAGLPPGSSGLARELDPDHGLVGINACSPGASERMGLRDVGHGLAKGRQAIVVDGEDGQIRVLLLLGETLVGGDENGEALRAGLGEQFGVT